MKEQIIDNIVIGIALLVLILMIVSGATLQGVAFYLVIAVMLIGVVAIAVKDPKILIKITSLSRFIKELEFKKAPALPAPVEAVEEELEFKKAPATEDRKARIIRDTLEKFNLPVELIHVYVGPRLKQYCFNRGVREKGGAVKVSEIRKLKEELAFALSDDSLMITRATFEACSFVGVVTENEASSALVALDDVLSGDERGLEIGLGADIVGNPVLADLSRMPHVLIAGATGSGKSVCINAMIVSLLRRLGPEQLQLLMIDPKMVELMPYNGISHLVVPVVTDMERVVGALTWALREMERRYKLFSEVGKRNHESYNKWAVKQGKEELPYIVIIIDELADLMMVAAGDVEQIICRIAQMARATGMHLILATQRPSVNVVTGLIKANVPTRISFAVTSGVDSRVILDQIGAENLLGRGDMFYQASDSGKLQRLQGCFVSDEELKEIIDRWRAEPVAEPPRDSHVTQVNKPVLSAKSATNHLPNHLPNQSDPATNHLPNHLPNQSDPATNHLPTEPVPLITPGSVEELIHLGQVAGWDEDIFIEKLILYENGISGNRVRDLIGGTKSRIQRKVAQTKERLGIV